MDCRSFIQRCRAVAAASFQTIVASHEGVMRAGWLRPAPVCRAHLIKACGKQVERGEDAAVGAQVVLLHHLLVLDLHGLGYDVRATGFVRGAGDH